MEQLLSNPDARNKLGEAARRRAFQIFGAEEMSRQVVKQYEVVRADERDR